MANRDYFRRPSLAGNTLRRNQTATLRGSVRRTDADGFSTVPYFPSLSGKSLQIKIESTVYVVNFVSNDFAAALTAINAIIDGHGVGVANGYAFDSDGSITIRSTSTDGLGAPLRATSSVEIVGGTAASLLGFDITFHELKTYGGELPSTPEGRIANPFGTVFIGRNENLTAESVDRGFARLASNMDVLFSDHNREDAVLRKITGFTNNSTYLTIPAGLSVPVGYGFLSNSSTKEDLSPFFQIIDSQTNQPYASRVVAVVKGPPASAYPTGWPYTNQSVWTDNLGRNLLGQQIDKATSVAITSITEGKYVSCAGSPFAQVAVGDFVLISSATNTDRLDNNGFKWVVEQVVSSSILAVRPMSKSELALVGYTPTTVQPSVELDGAKEPAQSFGAITVRTGAYATVPAAQPNSLNLVVSPAIPSGVPLELWMAQPRSLVDAGHYDAQLAAGQPLKQLASDYDLDLNGLLSSPTLGAPGGTTVSVGSFYVRWHGRVIRVPATTINAPVDAFAVSILYWDSDSNSVKFYVASTTPPTGIPTTLFSGPANPDPSLGGVGFQIARVVSTAGTTNSIAPTSKVVNGEKCSVTVGHGGDFSSLHEATIFLSMMNFVTTESNTANGAYSHFEIVLLSDQTITETVNIQLPSLTVRGVVSGIRLITNVPFNTNIFYCSGSFTLENLTLKVLTAQPTLVNRDASSVVSLIRVLNVTQDMTGIELFKVVRADYSGVDILIEDCLFKSSLYVVDGTAGDVSINRSSVSYQFLGGYTFPMLVKANAQTLRISNSSFTSWDGDGSGIVVSTVASPSLTDISIRDSQFDFGAQTASASVFMRVGTARCVIDGCYINMSGNAGINNEPGSYTHISNCTIVTNTFVGPAIKVSSFCDNIVSLAADNVTNQNQKLIEAGLTITGNQFLGTQAGEYITAATGAEVSGNYFYLGTSSWLSSTYAVLGVSGGRAHGNTIEGPGVCQYGINIVGSNSHVTDNNINTTSGVGIYVDGDYSVVDGNRVVGPAEAINGGSTRVGVIVSNNRLVSASIAGALPFAGEFSGNIYDIGSLTFTRSSSNKELLIRDCTFLGNFTFSASNQSWNGCRFVGTTTITGRLDSMPQQVSQVYFKGPTTLIGCQADNCEFENTGVTGVGIGSIFLTGCTVTNSSFIVFDSSKDIVRMRNCILDTCRSSILITDHLSIASDYNYVYNTTCKNSNYITGIYLSERTKVGVIDGCDIDSFYGDESTIAGPRDLTITNSSIMSVFVKRCGTVRVENSVIGRRVPGTFTSANSPNFRFEFDPWANVGSALSGTLTFTNGSATVTGVGTQFVKEIQVGDLIRPSGSPNTDLAKVDAISGATLTLSAVWGPATAAGVAAIAGRVRADIVGNSINHNPGFNNFELDGELAGFGACFNVSNNRTHRPGEITFVNTQINIDSPSHPLNSNLIYVGNTVFSNYNCLIESSTAVQIAISNNVFDGANGIVLDPNVTGTFSGIVSGNLIGYLGVEKARGLSITGNCFKGPWHPVVRIWDSLDVVFDGNYVYLTVPSSSDKVMTLGITTRWRLTNNVIGKAFSAGAGSTNSIMDFQSSPDYGFIGGNHFFSVGSPAPAAPSCSTFVGGNTKWLLDAAVGVGPPANFGGTQSGSTS